MTKALRGILGRRKLSAILGGVGCILLAAAVLLLAFSEGQTTSDDDAVLFSADAQEGDRVFICPQYMSEEFASFTALESDRFYLMLSPALEVYIVCISDDDLEPYLPLQDFTYSDSAAQPDIPEVYGTCVPLEEELIPYAVEEINLLFDSEIVTEDTLSDVTGAYYIDTTASAPSSALIPACLIAAALLLTAAAALVWRRISFARVSAQTLAGLRDGPDVLGAQFEQPEALRFPKTGLWLTDSYLVGTAQGLRAVPLGQLKGVRGLLRGRRLLLCADDRGGAQHILCAALRGTASTGELRDCIRALSQRQPGLAYGSERCVLPGEADIAEMSGFFAADENSDLRVRERLDENGMPIRPNYALGVLGALLGALLGGALWAGVGMLGYISGLVGGAMIWLALKGFQKLGGVLDKRGAVIAAVLAVLMIPAANYVVYAWSYCGAMGDRYTFGRALAETWGVMRANDTLGGFFGDVGLGLLFSALVGWPMLKSAFSPAPAGAAAMRAAPEEDEPDDGPGVLHPRKAMNVVGIVASVVGMALFLFLAVMLVISEEEDPLGLIAMCLVFAAAFAAGIFYMLRENKSRIEYDAHGVRLVRGGKTLEFGWNEVTELRFDNPSRLRIAGPAGKIRFDLGWAGWEGLVRCARSHAGAALR